MKAFKHRFRALAHLSFLAFILIQITPAWVKMDYSLTDTPCPLHALRAQLFGHDHAESLHDHDHPNLMSRAEQAAFLDKTGHEPYDIGVICLPSAPALQTAAADRTPTPPSTHEQPKHEEDTPKPWFCPYCSVREIAVLPVDFISIPAPREEAVAVLAPIQSANIKANAAARPYQPRAPPAFPEA